VKENRQRMYRIAVGEQNILSKLYILWAEKKSY